MAAQKRMLTVTNSKLAKAELPVVLLKEEAWRILPLETRQQLYSLLPVPAEGEAPLNPDVHPLDSPYAAYIVEELTRWQDGLKDGKETKKWREQAALAGKEREAGKFTDWQRRSREETWGKGIDDFDESKKDSQSNEDFKRGKNLSNGTGADHESESTNDINTWPTESTNDATHTESVDQAQKPLDEQESASDHDVGKEKDVKAETGSTTEVFKTDESAFELNDLASDCDSIEAEDASETGDGSDTNETSNTKTATEAEDSNDAPKPTSPYENDTHESAKRKSPDSDEDAKRSKSAKIEKVTDDEASAS